MTSWTPELGAAHPQLILLFLNSIRDGLRYLGLVDVVHRGPDSEPSPAQPPKVVAAAGRRDAPVASCTDRLSLTVGSVRPPEITVTLTYIP